MFNVTFHHCYKEVEEWRTSANGQVHFRGVDLVRYGAEREAQIAQILASDLEELQEGNWEMRGMAVLKDYFAVVAAGVAAVKTSSTR